MGSNHCWKFPPRSPHWGWRRGMGLGCGCGESGSTRGSTGGRSDSWPVGSNRMSGTGKGGYSTVFGTRTDKSQIWGGLNDRRIRYTYYGPHNHLLWRNTKGRQQRRHTGEFLMSSIVEIKYYKISSKGTWIPRKHLQKTKRILDTILM